MEALAALVPIILIVVMYIWPICDILNGDKTFINKCAWIAVVIIFPLIGAAIYAAAGRDHK